MFAALLPLALATTLTVPVERYTLPNGLVVVLHEDHRVPTVIVDLLFRVGSKDERNGRTGFAHLFEHLMFMGTKNVPNGVFDSVLEGAGGYDNASTNEDYTNYFDAGPSNLLETFLWLEADRLSSLPDDMTKAKVDLQRDVVKNERRQSYENRPYGRAELEVPDKLYPASHPYHHPVIGSHADLDAASVGDVKAFFPPVLRALERHPRGERRLLGGRRQEARREILRVDGEEAGAAPRGAEAGDAGEGGARDLDRRGAAAARDAGVALAGRLSRRRRGVRRVGGGARRRPLVAAVPGAGVREEAGRVGGGRAAHDAPWARSS